MGLVEFAPCRLRTASNMSWGRGVSHMWPFSFCCRAQICTSKLYFEGTRNLYVELRRDFSETFNVWSEARVFTRRFTRFLTKWAVPEAWRSVRQPEGQISARDWTRRDSRERARFQWRGRARTDTHVLHVLCGKRVNKSKPWRDSRFSISAGLACVCFRYFYLKMCALV